MGFVEPELMSTQYSDGAESRARQAASHGCDEIVSVVAKLDIGGEEWYQCMDVACYGGKWYNLSFVGYIGHLLGLSYPTAVCSRPRRFERPSSGKAASRQCAGRCFFVRASCSAAGGVAWGYRNEAGIFHAGRRALPRRGERDAEIMRFSPKVFPEGFPRRFSPKVFPEGFPRRFCPVVLAGGFSRWG